MVSRPSWPGDESEKVERECLDSTNFFSFNCTKIGLGQSMQQHGSLFWPIQINRQQFTVAVLCVHIAQQLELAFSEDDYSTQEGPGSTINAQITKSGQSSEAVTVRVVPMTFEEYRSRSGQIPYQDIDPAEGEKIYMALLGGTENEIASYPRHLFIMQRNCCKFIILVENQEYL